MFLIPTHPSFFHVFPPSLSPISLVLALLLEFSDVLVLSCLHSLTSPPFVFFFPLSHILASALSGLSSICFSSVEIR